MLKPQQVKVELKRKGWSYRRAEKVIHRSYAWISHVLNGHNKSQPVLRALHALPDLRKPRRAAR